MPRFKLSKLLFINSLIFLCLASLLIIVIKELSQCEFFIQFKSRIVFFINCILSLCFILLIKNSSKTKLFKRIKDLESALKASEEAYKAKSDFLANMSHELRTPLNAILGFSSAMQQEVFGPIKNTTYQQYLCYIQKSGEHLLNLINDVLDLSKIEANKTKISPKWIDIKYVLTDVLQIISGCFNISERKITIHCEENIPNLWADEKMLKQMLLNLLSNAIKFTHIKGEIQIHIYITTRSKYCICIQDNGIGIPKNKIEAIKQPFTQLEDVLSKTHRGTGLGLSLVDKFMILHKGKMEIKSTVKKGTKILLLFPSPYQQGEHHT